MSLLPKLMQEPVCAADSLGTGTAQRRSLNSFLGSVVAIAACSLLGSPVGGGGSGEGHGDAVMAKTAILVGRGLVLAQGHGLLLLLLLSHTISSNVVVAG